MAAELYQIHLFAFTRVKEDHIRHIKHLLIISSRWHLVQTLNHSASNLQASHRRPDNRWVLSLPCEADQTQIWPWIPALVRFRIVLINRLDHDLVNIVEL